MKTELKKIIFWGGTGQSIVLEEFLTDIGFELIAIFDNNKDCKSPFTGVQIYHGMDELDRFIVNNSVEDIYFMIAIGGAYGKDRSKLHQILENKGLKPTQAIHPSSYVSKNAVTSDGCQILANSTIGARAKMGVSCIINTSASIDHECVLGNGVHIGPGAHLAGCIQIGDYSFIGTGAIILPHIKIGENCIVGAGSVVTKDMPDNSKVYGNPARIKD